MTLHKILWPALAAVALATPLSAQAAYYVFDADATGTFNGPFTGEISGSFTVDPSRINSESTFTQNGSQVFGQYQAGDDVTPRGLVKWTVHGAFGEGYDKASIVRILRPDGSSELTISAAQMDTRGYTYDNLFKITYFSDTDVLFTDRSSDLSSILQADRASGSYDLYYAYFSHTANQAIIRENHLTFNVTTTAVPEPEVLGLMLAGLAVLPWLKARGRRAVRG